MQYFAAKVHMYLSMDFKIIFKIDGVTAITRYSVSLHYQNFCYE